MRMLRMPILLVLLGVAALIVWSADAVACRWRCRQTVTYCASADPSVTTPSTSMPYADTEDAEPIRKMPRVDDTPEFPELPPLEVLLKKTARSTRLPHPAAAMILVLVPNGAQIYLDDFRSRQVTPIRRFHTPPLEAGDYSYEATVEWNVNGVRVRQKRTIPITPGQIVEVVFRESELIAQAQASASAE